jgi:hypothetical protein
MPSIRDLPPSGRLLHQRWRKDAPAFGRERNVAVGCGRIIVDFGGTRAYKRGSLGEGVLFDIVGKRKGCAGGGA